MTDLNSFYKVDAVDDVMAEDMNRLISSSDYATFRNVETLSADKTLTNTDCPIQYLTPSGANKNVILPAAAVTNHKFVIINPTGTSYSLVVKTSGSVSTLATLTAGQGGVFYSSGGEYITISGGGSSLTKASSTDVATGTDDAKYVTSLAIKNSVNVPNVAPGASNNVLTSNGSAWTSAASIREKLSADRTYYVRTDGNDSNTGLANTAGGAFLTIQKAIDVVSTLDISIYNAIIQVGDGTYVQMLTLKNTLGAGGITIQGNSGTPDNVVIDGQILKNTPGTTYTIKDCKLIKSSSSDGGIAAKNGSYIKFSGVNFSTGLTYQLFTQTGGYIEAIGNYKITAGAQIHLYANGGQINIVSVTITITGTPAFSVAFAFANQAGIILSLSATWSGSATGSRYSVLLNGVINTFGGGASYFPGNSAGTTATGGQYA